MRAIAIASTLAALTLGGCGSPSEAPTPTPTPTSSEPAKPAFAADGDKVVAMIKGFGAPWASAKASDPMVDTKTGGTVRILNSPDGSAQIFSRVEGKAWQVKLITGAPNNCGDVQPLVAAFPKLLAALNPGGSVTKDQLGYLNDHLLAFDRKTETLGGIDVTTQGGCTRWLTLSVPEAVADQAAAPKPAA